jgi:hypothetical protein
MSITQHAAAIEAQLLRNESPTKFGMLDRKAIVVLSCDRDGKVRFSTWVTRELDEQRERELLLAFLDEAKEMVNKYPDPQILSPPILS